MPTAIVTFSQGVDATRTDESMVAKAEADPLLDRASLDRLSSLYVVDQDRRNPLLSPAVAADLTGLPPVLMQVGTNEMLLDDARRLALRAFDAKVDVVLDITAMVRTCSSHSPAYSTRPTRRLTGPRSSCASTSAADREDDHAAP